MPFLRKKYAARKIQRKFRKWRRRKRYRRPASVRTGSLTIRQKEFTSLTLGDTTQPFPQAIPTGIYQPITFNIAGMPNLVEYQRLFDQYRINAISYTLLPTGNTNDTIQNGFTFASSVNLDGGTLGVQTIPEMLSRANCKTSPWTSTGGMSPYKKLYLKPRWMNTLVEDDASGITAQGLGNRKTWLDMRFPEIDHHGLDLMWFNAANQINAPQRVNVIITYYIQFRKVR